MVWTNGLPLLANDEPSMMAAAGLKRLLAVAEAPRTDVTPSAQPVSLVITLSGGLVSMAKPPMPTLQLPVRLAQPAPNLPVTSKKEPGLSALVLRSTSSTEGRTACGPQPTSSGSANDIAERVLIKKHFER